jgi:hypothetical protein
MLDFGKNTLFVAKSTQPSMSDGWGAIAKIIDYYDTMGYNCLVFKRSNLYCQSKTHECFLYKDIPNLITENIFRVNLIIIEVDKNYGHLLSYIREVTDLPVIFVGKCIEDCYNTNHFEYIYKFRIGRSTIGGFFDDDKYYVEDVKNNWTSTIEELKTQYIRNEKINNIFDDKKDV